MPGWEFESDDALLVAAAGDSAAFGVFYRCYEGPVLAFFVRRTRDGELAADLTAEVFARALEACGRFRPGGGPASAWLFGIAHHALAKSRRRGVVQDRDRPRSRWRGSVLTATTSLESSIWPTATTRSWFCLNSYRLINVTRSGRGSWRSSRIRRSRARSRARPMSFANASAGGWRACEISCKALSAVTPETRRRRLLPHPRSRRQRTAPDP